jgi:hypothetical protein
MTEPITRVTRSVISSPDTQAAIWFLGALSQLRVTGEQTGEAFAVTSATARFLTLHTPAGFEQFATEAGEPARALTLPPPPAGPPDFAALAQAAAGHQITILAPAPQP